jgi:DNA-binding FrmR family transcriptional regulator
MNTRLYTKEPTKSKIIHRLKIAQGHLKKVIIMVENDKYCIDVIHQSQAVQAALREIDKVILENHLQSCVIDEVKKGKANDKKLIEEILSIFEKLNK